MGEATKKAWELAIMQEGGEKLAAILGQLLKMVQVGANLLAIEAEAVRLIKLTGGEPAFQKVPRYAWATCLNINDAIVHSIPRNYQLQEGDVLNIDIGLLYNGYNLDTSYTKLVKSLKLKVESLTEKERFLETGKRALTVALKQARAGNRVGHISQAIQQVIEQAGYSCARTLTGHGIGKKLHEPPQIPCFLKGTIEETPLLKAGMTLAVEVIYAQGEAMLVVDPQDKWTIRTKDGRIAAVFEQTIALQNDGCLILTKFDW